MSTSADANAVKEKPIWGLPAIGRYLGVSEVTMHRWIRAEAPETRALHRTSRRRWYAYPSELDAVMKR